MSRVLQVALLLLILAGWVLSYFLPALDLGKSTLGYMAAFLSANVCYTFFRSHQLRDLYFGSFWIANIFMLASPFGLWRARLGKGGIFLVLMTLWDLLTLSFAAYIRTQHDLGTVKLLVGWYTWEATLVAMTVLLFATRAGRSIEPE